jgi:hypothetical protein
VHQENLVKENDTSQPLAHVSSLAVVDFPGALGGEDFCAV